MLSLCFCFCLTAGGMSPAASSSEYEVRSITASACCGESCKCGWPYRERVPPSRFYIARLLHDAHQGRCHMKEVLGRTRKEATWKPSLPAEGC